MPEFEKKEQELMLDIQKLYGVEFGEINLKLQHGKVFEVKICNTRRPKKLENVV